jgi:hypothetical protein
MKPLVVKAFIKKEATGLKDPRNISTVPADHRTEYSRFTLPLSKFLAATTSWYAFSRPPAEFAKLLHEKASKWSSAVENDYSRFDGTNGPMQSTVIRVMLISAFGREHTAAITALTTFEIDPPAFTKGGAAYSPGFGTITGSPSTSLRNTLNNAFVAYCALRESRKSKDNAYKALGIYGGDDGLDDGSIAKALARVTLEVGLKSKPTMRPKNGPVMFLGRVYNNPWAGPESFSDPFRHLDKIQHTANPDPKLTPADHTLNKARGFAATDPQTPLLAEWTAWAFRTFANTSSSSSSSPPPTSDYWWARVVAELGCFPQLPEDESYDALSTLTGLSIDELKERAGQLLQRGAADVPRPGAPLAPITCNTIAKQGDFDIFIPGTNPACPFKPPSHKVRTRRRDRVTRMTSRVMDPPDSAVIKPPTVVRPRVLPPAPQQPPCSLAPNNPARPALLPTPAPNAPTITQPRPPAAPPRRPRSPPSNGRPPLPNA